MAVVEGPPPQPAASVAQTMPATAIKIRRSDVDVCGKVSVGVRGVVRHDGVDGHARRIVG